MLIPGDQEPWVWHLPWGTSLYSSTKAFEHLCLIHSSQSFSCERSHLQLQRHLYVNPRTYMPTHKGMSLWQSWKDNLPLYPQVSTFNNNIESSHKGQSPHNILFTRKPNSQKLKNTTQAFKSNLQYLSFISFYVVAEAAFVVVRTPTNISSFCYLRADAYSRFHRLQCWRKQTCQNCLKLSANNSNSHPILFFDFKSQIRDSLFSYPNTNLLAFALELPLGLLLLHYASLGRLCFPTWNVVVLLVRASSDRRRAKELFLHGSYGLGYQLLRRSVSPAVRDSGDRGSFGGRLVHGRPSWPVLPR